MVNKIQSKMHSEALDHEEARVVLQLINEIRRGLHSDIQSYVFAHDFEYHVVEKGSDDNVGDLILTDGQGRYALVEAKYLNFKPRRNGSETRRQQMKTAKGQVKTLLVKLPKHQSMYYNARGFVVWNNKDETLAVQEMFADTVRDESALSYREETNEQYDSTPEEDHDNDTPALATTRSQSQSSSSDLTVLGMSALGFLGMAYVASSLISSSRTKRWWE